MLERAVLVEPVGHCERLAVIGNGDVARAPRPGAARAIVQASARPSVAVVCMWRSPCRSLGKDESGKRALFGCLDLASVLAKLRGN